MVHTSIQTYKHIYI